MWLPGDVDELWLWATTKQPTFTNLWLQKRKIKQNLVELIVQNTDLKATIFHNLNLKQPSFTNHLKSTLNQLKS